ncbi:MAG: citramalate synthase [Elusimicrobia bacterium]|jgi:2-isopropylmalate synthase|nr:citramalate synthase [Elusimicrobiota bacterium]
MNKKIFILDTTLRDGTQSEGISFSVEDKLKIAKKLDWFGVDYIEGGWPGSNPKDEKFFERMKEINLQYSKMTAFTSTRRKDVKVEKDKSLNKVIESGAAACCVFGKSWDMHVKTALKTTLDENLKMIEDSVRYLKETGIEVIYDAEHYFDGYFNNPDYALRTIKAAEAGGADYICLCETNGGRLPDEVASAVKKAKSEVKAGLGIHAHNDSEVAVANSIAAVSEGAVMVHGTVNGYGERCGNANICSVIPNLQLKLGYKCIDGDGLKKLTELSRYVDEIANKIPLSHQPFVGHSAFAHKGGIHVSAVRKDSSTYEHIEPKTVGNKRKILISELAGASNIKFKSKEFGIDFSKDNDQVGSLLKTIKKKEDEGYYFEGAEASFELIMLRQSGVKKKFFDLEGFRVIIESNSEGELKSEATIKVKVNGVKEHTASEGSGPVNALDNALRKALEKFYPELREVNLKDFKVRVIDARQGTAGKVRVLIESGDKKNSWGTIGVSENLIEASWEALVDSIEYKLLKG